MGIRIDIKSTDFYNELSAEKQKQFFNVSEKKFLPAIDNIYYGLILENDCVGNLLLKPLFERLDELKSQCRESRKPQPFGCGLLVELLSFDMYTYCLSNTDLYDIFITSCFPNDSTPRIVVQLRAYGLWQYGAEKMLADSYDSVLDILEPYRVTVKRLRENRIDYCYHTNAIQKPEKIFSERNIYNQMKTTFEDYTGAGRLKQDDEGHVIKCADYLALGNKSSNNILTRFYNKGLEVVEKGYKGFFFEIWKQKGLISEYDKFCFERALAERNYDYIHKAKLEFYLINGTNERVKQEFRLTIKDKNSTLKDFERLANQYMPEVTTVLNIEYMTKRKFYYYSDEFIDGILKTAPERSDVPEPLKRLYKIIDNRKVFLDYLTSKTVCFKRKDGRYAAWWERLRNTKLDGLNLDTELVRDYSKQLDEKYARKRFINTVVTNSVYSGNLKTGFISDVADMLCDLNDNEVQAKRIRLYVLSDGQKLKELYSSMLGDYKHKKAVKHQKVKNRLNQPD